MKESVRKVGAVVSSAVLLFSINAMATEFIINGDFENTPNHLLGWSRTINVQAVDVGGDHDFVAEMSIGGWFDSELSQVLDPGCSEIEVSFDYKLWAADFLPIVDWGTDSFSVSLGTTSLLSQPLNDAFDCRATETPWTTFHVTLANVGQLGGLKFAFNVENWGSGDEGQLFKAYVDNVSVRCASLNSLSVPDPCSMIMILGFGLVTMEGVRRKLLK